MKSIPTRSYVQTARAESAAANAERILNAVVDLVREAGGPPTLDAVADRAGVSVQTVLRRFGSRQELYEAAAARVRARITAERMAAPVGDVRAAIGNLLDHYEAWGDVALAMLSAEGRTGATGPGTAEEGRSFHRRWVEHVFEPQLAGLRGAVRERRVDQLVAATDVYVWKILSRDLGRPRRRVKDTLVELVERIVAPL